MTGPLKKLWTPSLTCQHNQSLFSKRSGGHECLNFCLYVLKVSWKGWLKDLDPDNGRKGLSTSQIHPGSYSLKQNFTVWLWDSIIWKGTWAREQMVFFYPGILKITFLLPRTLEVSRVTALEGTDVSWVSQHKNRVAVATYHLLCLPHC